MLRLRLRTGRSRSEAGTAALMSTELPPGAVSIRSAFQGKRWKDCKVSPARHEAIVLVPKSEHLTSWKPVGNSSTSLRGVTMRTTRAPLFSAFNHLSNVNAYGRRVTVDIDP